MTKSDLKAFLNSLIEDLASIEHRRWVHWQTYVHHTGVLQPDGSLLIPAELITRWNRQISLSYADLHEDEKESDREQVRIYLKTIVDEFSKRIS